MPAADRHATSPDRWQANQAFDLVSGSGSLAQLPELVDGRQGVLICSGGATSRGLAARVRELVPTIVDTIDDTFENPGIADLERQTATIRTATPEVLVAVGGGSVIDTAKVIAALLGDEGCSLAQHVRGESSLDLTAALPVIAIPTTAGTGSEVTPFATVWDHEAKQKHSVSGPPLVPESVILDPDLTLTLPSAVTASTGLDAVSQALESLWNRGSNPVSRAFAVASLRRSLSFLPVVVATPDDLDARTAMLEASMLAGLAIAQTRTAIAHSMSYPLTAHHGLPHGFAASFTLPAITGFNAETEPTWMAAVAVEIGAATPSDLERDLVDLLVAVGAPTAVRTHVPTLAAAEALTGEMVTPGRADNNIRPVSADDLLRILRRTDELLGIW